MLFHFVCYVLTIRQENGDPAANEEILLDTLPKAPGPGKKTPPLRPRDIRSELVQLEHNILTLSSSEPRSHESPGPERFQNPTN